MNKYYILTGTEFAVITKLYFGALGKRLSDLEIDRYYSLVLYLSSCKNMQTQQDIAKEFKMDKSVLVRVIDYLSGKGFVQRVVNTTDRRTHFIQLTQLAHEKIPMILKAMEDINNIVFKGMDEIQAKSFMLQLKQIKDNLSGEPAIDFELNYKNNEA